mmetsp:Transcript_6366/g.19251  ORF Transcript_6366/g.19251 Transcript_6366/m.19251 type:complete len:284 (-) Transcript_6366:300-1151(-)
MFQFNFGGIEESNADKEDKKAVTGAPADSGDKRGWEVQVDRARDQNLASEKTVEVETRNGSKFYVVSGVGGRGKSDRVAGEYEGGGKVWEAAIDLVEHCIASNVDFTGKRVLDLGCGHALPSICAAQRGAQEIVLSDFNEEVLVQAAIRNFWLNAAGDMVAGNRVRLMCGHWMSLPGLLQGGERFDVIMTAETIYDEVGLQEVASLIFKLLKFNTGIALVASKDVYFSVGGTMRAFKHAIMKHAQASQDVQLTTVHRSGNANGVSRSIVQITIRSMHTQGNII